MRSVPINHRALDEQTHAAPYGMLQAFSRSDQRDPLPLPRNHPVWPLPKTSSGLPSLLPHGRLSRSASVPLFPSSLFIPLTSYCPTSLFVAGTQPPPIFDISAAFGPSTDLLIRTAAQGLTLAAHFDASFPLAPLVLMRGHGATLIAPSLKLAVYRAVYTQTNAEILTSLSGLAGGVDRVGEMEPKFLSEGESQMSADSVAGQVGRAWSVWCRELEK